MNAPPFNYRLCSDCGENHSGECEDRHHKDARHAARRLLSGQSCTEDVMTQCLYDFAKQAVQELAQKVIDSTATDISDIDAEMNRVRDALIKHAPECAALLVTEPMACLCLTRDEAIDAWREAAQERAAVVVLREAEIERLKQEIARVREAQT